MEMKVEDGKKMRRIFTPEQKFEILKTSSAAKRSFKCPTIIVSVAAGISSGAWSVRFC